MYQKIILKSNASLDIIDAYKILLLNDKDFISLIRLLQVFPYFLKSEDNREIGRVSKKYHGTGGPMTVERFVLFFEI